MPLREQIIILLILLGLSAFFSGAETALISISKLRAKHLAEKHPSKINNALRKLKENPSRMLTTILIGNNVVNIGAASFATTVAMQFFGSYAVGVATGVMTFLVLVFGEITPKSLAMHYNEQYAKIVAIPVWYLSVILYPAIKIFDAFYNTFTKNLRNKSRSPTVSEEYLKGIVTASQEEGSIKEIEKEMVHNIFEFDDINASEIMTPKTDMFLLKSNLKLNDAIDIMLKNPFSRVPIYKDAVDNIIGIVSLRDVIDNVKKKKKGNITLEKIMRKPYFVPEQKKIDMLLRQFQKKKKHMAIIVDEHGIITGLVTMEDVLEQIVGEIMDETDRRDPNIRKLKRKEWMVKGKTDIEEVNEKIKINLPDEEDYDTLGGYILNKSGHIPKRGEKILYNKKWTLIIEEVSDHRIIRVKIVKK